MDYSRTNLLTSAVQAQLSFRRIKPRGWLIPALSIVGSNTLSTCVNWSELFVFSPFPLSCSWPQMPPKPTRARERPELPIWARGQERAMGTSHQPSHHITSRHCLGSGTWKRNQRSARILCCGKDSLSASYATAGSDGGMTQTLKERHFNREIYLFSSFLDRKQAGT